MQQRLRKGDFELRKVKGEMNPADIFTKHLESQARIDHLLKLFNCELRDGRPSKAPELRREDIAAMCEISVAESHVPSHDSSLLPHQVAADQLDRYFPRASIASAPLGEADEVDDPDCVEPRTIPRTREPSSRINGKSKSQAHLCRLEEPPPGTVIASRAGTPDLGNRRPSGRARSSPRVHHRPCVALMGGRGPVGGDERLEDIIVCNVSYVSEISGGRPVRGQFEQQHLTGSPSDESGKGHRKSSDESGKGHRKHLTGSPSEPRQR